jgi:cytochrome c556
LEKLLPEQFLTWGTQTHQGFDALAASVTAGDAADTVLVRLGAITQMCVTCHATYRLAVP